MWRINRPLKSSEGNKQVTCGQCQHPIDREKEQYVVNGGDYYCFDCAEIAIAERLDEIDKEMNELKLEKSALDRLNVRIYRNLEARDGQKS